MEQNWNTMEHEVLGNTKTKTRVNPSKYWCFTLNNYTMEHLEHLEHSLSKDLYIIGKEVGESGTKHLQGYIEFHKRVRPVEHIGIKEIHWERTKGSREDNIRYCSKDN